jgi:hypothetical protein
MRFMTSEIIEISPWTNISTDGTGAGGRVNPTRWDRADEKLLWVRIPTFEGCLHANVNEIHCLFTRE